jgi:hypothetical protein
MLTKSMIHFALIAFTLFAMLSSNIAEANTASSLYYTISRVWFDPSYIYIVYEKKRVTSHYSLSDIHGTVVKEKSELFLSKLSRESGEGSKVFSLNNGEEATSIIYRDEDFNIISVAEGVRLSGNKKSLTFPMCKEPIWANQGGTRQDIIRVRNRLLFCGVLFDQSGDLVLEIPKSIAHVIENDYQENHFLLDPLVAISAISNDNLLIVRPNPGSHITELKIGAWSLNMENMDAEMKWVKHVLPPSPGGYEFDTYRAYSPANFVLRPVAFGDKSVLLCTEARCERVNVHDKSSFLVVDEEQRQLIEIVPGYILDKLSITVNTSNY